MRLQWKMLCQAMASSPQQQSYRAYLIGPDGHIVGREDLICSTDAEAVEQASRFTDKHEVEVWNECRLVTKLARRNRSK